MVCLVGIFQSSHNWNSKNPVEIPTTETKARRPPSRLKPSSHTTKRGNCTGKKIKNKILRWEGTFGLK